MSISDKERPIKKWESRWKQFELPSLPYERAIGYGPIRPWPRLKFEGGGGGGDEKDMFQLQLEYYGYNSGQPLDPPNEAQYDPKYNDVNHGLVSVNKTGGRRSMDRYHSKSGLL